MFRNPGRIQLTQVWRRNSRAAADTLQYEERPKARAEQAGLSKQELLAYLHHVLVPCCKALQVADPLLDLCCGWA
jgi:hypothetical protein